MNRLLSARSVLAAAVAFGGLALASAAQAHADVRVWMGVPGYVEPQQAQAYGQPVPMYGPPPAVYVQPAPVYGQPQAVYSGHERDWREREWRRQHDHRNGPWGDADRDGVANRYDRAPFDPYRR